MTPNAKTATKIVAHFATKIVARRRAELRRRPVGRDCRIRSAGRVLTANSPKKTIAVTRWFSVASKRRAELRVRALWREDCAVDKGVSIRSRKTARTSVRRLVSPFLYADWIDRASLQVTDGPKARRPRNCPFAIRWRWARRRRRRCARTFASPQAEGRRANFDLLA